MPKLLKLNLSGLRNLEPVSIQPCPGFNLIYGANGSGKTSLLEAIYLLARAKTFRSTSRAPIVQHGAENCVIHADLAAGQSLGFSRARQGEQISRVNAKSIKNLAELTEQLPVQLINADAFKIIEAGPSSRRAFLDWGVFHVEHQFIRQWQLMQRALINRNALLKSKHLREDELAPWTEEFCQFAESVHTFRSKSFAALQPLLTLHLQELLPELEISIRYEPGWDDSQSLKQILAMRLEQDRRYGHTSNGPHRADLKIETVGLAAADVLSRGQQKLLVIAMKISQAALLAERCGEQCLFLIDDLPAELDAANRARVLSILAQSGVQAFVTGISPEDLLISLQNHEDKRLFHVKHGKITTQESGQN